MFGGIWAFVGLTISIAFTAAGGPFWADFALDRRGVAAVAAPTGIGPTSGHANGRTIFHIDYQFVDAAGARRSGSCRTTDPGWIARAEQHEPLEIEYDPGRPALSRLRGQKASFFGLFVLFPFGFFVVGAAVMAAGGRRARRVRAIYVRGQAALATVTAVAATSLRVNNRRLIRVDYAFDTPIGRTIGQTTSRNPPPVGGQLWILHDPEDPKRNVGA
jgi:hypothetical protein